MVNVPIIELMKIWGELAECYHGVNGYGGDTVEIYAYRLMRYSPLVHSQENKSNLAQEAKDDLQANAAQDLYEICRLFWIEYGGKDSLEITIDDIPLFDWLRTVGYGFDHRVHIRIIRQQP